MKKAKGKAIITNNNPSSLLYFKTTLQYNISEDGATTGDAVGDPTESNISENLFPPNVI
jgi:hypothetical protein